MATVIKRCEHEPKQWSKCPDSWTVRWWDPQARKQREKTFKRDHAAARAFSKTIEAEKLTAPPAGAPKPVTFGEYVESVWLPALPLRASAGTVRIYSSVLRLHLLPAFGGTLLAGVAADREGVQAFLAGLTAGTAPVARTCLSAVLSEARMAGRVTDYRLTGLKLPAVSGKAEFDFPAHAQLTTLAAEMGELGPAVWIMRGCGLRPGEVLAVRRENFVSGRLRIDEQVQQPRTVVPLKARKPGEYRDIPVPSYVKKIIQAQPVKAGYLFPGVSYASFGHAFRKAAKAAGWAGHPHWLRHTFASVALSSGVPVTDVSRWLGHRSIEVTYRTYSHFIPSAWDSAREALDAEYDAWSAA